MTLPGKLKFKIVLQLFMFCSRTIDDQKIIGRAYDGDDFFANYHTLDEVRRLKVTGMKLTRARHLDLRIHGSNEVNERNERN